MASSSPANQPVSYSSPSTGQQPVTESLNALLQHPAIWRGQGQPTERRQPSTGFAVLDQRLPGGGWPRGALTEILCDRKGIGELSLLLPRLAAISQQAVAERQEHWIALVAPPYLPYAPAFQALGVDPGRLLVIFPPGQERNRDASQNDTPKPARIAWALEQALRSGACPAVLAWPEASHHTEHDKASRLSERQLRRLQLAAEEGQSWGVLFRHSQQAQQSSPAALRLRLTPQSPCRPSQRQQRLPAEPPAGLSTGTPTGALVEGIKCRGGRGFGPLPLGVPDLSTWR